MYRNIWKLATHQSNIFLALIFIFMPLIRTCNRALWLHGDDGWVSHTVFELFHPTLTSIILSSSSLLYNYSIIPQDAYLLFLSLFVYEFLNL